MAIAVFPVNIFVARKAVSAKAECNDLLELQGGVIRCNIEAKC